jgi:hypothetical protein
MTIEEVYDIFTAFADDIRDPAILDGMFARHINTAQMAVLKSHFKPEANQSPQGYANTQYYDEDFKELIYPISLNSDVDGKITYADIEATWDGEIVQGEDGVYEARQPPFFHLASALRGGVVSKWDRHNDYGVTIANPYKVPTVLFPKHRYFKDYLQFYPDGITKINMVVVRQPLHVWFDQETPINNIDPELSDSLMFDVIFRALTYAGINIRETQLRDYMEREENKL